jgi:hypothetical protein
LGSREKSLGRIVAFRSEDVKNGGIGFQPVISSYVRQAGSLAHDACRRVVVKAEHVAQTPPFAAASYSVDANQPLRLGTGTNGPLNGTLADVRIDRRAINATEVDALSKSQPKE